MLLFNITTDDLEDMERTSSDDGSLEGGDSDPPLTPEELDRGPMFASTPENEAPSMSAVESPVMDGERFIFLPSARNVERNLNLIRRASQDPVPAEPAPPGPLPSGNRIQNCWSNTWMITSNACR